MPTVIQPGGKVVVLKLTAEEIRDALLSLPDEERRFVITGPESGEKKVYTIQRNTDGELEYVYETVPES